MYRRAIAALAFVLCASSVSAQTIALAFDRASVPALNNAYGPLPLELDGNPATREWVQHRTDPKSQQFEIRGLQARSTLCVGEWVRPYEVVAANLIQGDVMLFGLIAGPIHGTWRYVVYGIRGYYEVTIPYGC